MVLDFYSINLLIMLLRSSKNLSHRVSCSFSCQHEDFVFLLHTVVVSCSCLLEKHYHFYVASFFSVKKVLHSFLLHHPINSIIYYVSF
jgi:hypothetical protein